MTPCFLLLHQNFEHHNLPGVRSDEVPKRQYRHLNRNTDPESII